MDDYLRTDGVLVLKLIRLNMGVHVSRELVIALFPHFVESAKRAGKAKNIHVDVGFDFDSPTSESTTDSPSKERFLPLARNEKQQHDAHIHRTSPV